MVTTTVGEIQQDFLGYLQRVKRGETVLVLQNDRPVAELRPVAIAPAEPRPYGLCAGQFVVPDDFDSPLPDDVLLHSKAHDAAARYAHLPLVHNQGRALASWMARYDSRSDKLRVPQRGVRLGISDKQQLGKLQLPGPAEAFLPEERDKHRKSALPIEEPVLVHLAALPSLHHDPFDRMLISQALQHDMTMLTVDQAIRAYPVKVMSSTA